MDEVILDGQKIILGCNLPTEDEQALMAAFPMYPENRYLDTADIEKTLKGDYYLQSRKELSPWMINQNPLGKCNASALKGAMEQMRRNLGFPHVILSDNDAYMQMNRGVDQGSALVAGFKVGMERGISPLKITVNGREYKIPLDAFNNRHVPAEARNEAARQAARFKGWEWYRAPEDFDGFKRCLASELARGNPVVFAWHVGSNSMRLRNGYVVTGRGVGNHATYFHSAKFVGGSDLVHPDMKNSWGPSVNPDYGRTGTSWGDGGYALFTMEQAFSCNRHHYTYVCVGAKPDPIDEVVK